MITRYESMSEVPMNEDEKLIMGWVEIAQHNVDSHIGDCVNDEMSDEDILIEVETLAIDALIDNGCPEDLIDDVVNKIAEPYRVMGVAC